MSTKTILAILDIIEVSINSTDQITPGKVEHFVKVKQCDTAVRIIAKSEDDALTLARKIVAAVVEHADLSLEII